MRAPGEISSAKISAQLSRAESIAQISSLYALGHIMWGERLSEAIITQGRGLYKSLFGEKVTRTGNESPFRLNLRDQDFDSSFCFKELI
jgi:hypothetical protein